MYLPFPPEPDDDEADDDVVHVDLSGEIQFDGITSGADPVAWDPVLIEEEEEQAEDDEVLDTELDADEQPPSVTSGNDPAGP